MKKIWGYIAGYVRAMDKWLLLLWLGSSCLSVLFLLGVHYSGLTANSWSRVITQVIAVLLGLFTAIIISLFDYHTLLKLWKLYLPACLIIVALTFFIGDIRGDNRAWISITIAGRSMSLQPAEFLKISFITTLAMHIDHIKDNINRISNVAMLCLHAGAHVALIQIQGDSGTALIFLFIFLFMVFYAGISWKYISAAAAALAAALPVLWFKILTPDQQMRIRTVFDSSFMNEKYEYHQYRGKLALGSGGMRGIGIFSNGHVYVPEMYNDFLFTFIGESLGFIGSLGIIVLLAAIAFKVLYNSSVALDFTGKLICAGVFAMIVAQMVINLGMCIGVLPVIGVTLPLFSSGGTSVLALYIGLGFLLSIYSHSSKGLFYEKR